MRSKILLIIAILGILLFSAIFFLYPYPYLQAANNKTEKKVETIQIISISKQVHSGLPIHLTIPKINVSAPIEHVGLTPEGDMDTPKNSMNAAWYDQGTRPGENGSAVIDGHFGIKNGSQAVFDNLYKLRKGDLLYVEDEKKVVTTFVVRESRSFDPKADASEVFFSNDGKSHLNLITCEGVWDKISKSYSKRLIVFTDKK